MEAGNMDRGYIQVYTGDGKGKTTAALGLALRAAGAGLRVFIAQFVKNRACSEHEALERFSDLITVKQFGEGLIIGRETTRSDIDSARSALKEAEYAISSGRYRVVILDEINIALHYGLIELDDVLHILENKPGAVELVLTGRHANEKIIEMADLVTEMKSVKHYSHDGVSARRGIEY